MDGAGDGVADIDEVIVIVGELECGNIQIPWIRSAGIGFRRDFHR